MIFVFVNLQFEAISDELVLKFITASEETVPSRNNKPSTTKYSPLKLSLELPVRITFPPSSAFRVIGCVA